jgi:type I restriction enzyme S subunit
MSTALTNIETEKQLVPSIRFNGYESIWPKVSMKSVVKASQGLAILRSNRFEEDGPNRYNYITIPYLLGGECLFIENPQESVKCKEDDVIVTRTGSGVGQIWTGASGVIHNNFFKVSPVEGKVRKDFIYHFLLNPFVQKKMKSFAGSSAIPDLNHSEFYLIPFNLPSLPEQQKIASFLSAVDEKIQQLTKKKELLEQYKKGLMQKLFSGQLRFKDEKGKDYPDWEEKKIGDFLVESRIKGDTGDLAKKLTVKLWGRGVFFKKDVTPGSAQTQYFIRKSGQFIYSKLDFLNCAFAIIPEELDGLQSTVDLPCFDFKKEIQPYYILEKVKQLNFYKQFGDRADGSRKAKRIHAETFCSFPIAVPCKKEQQKIATYLSGIDTKIESVNNQITQSQTFKKGLLQQMFV